jgi:hypothetical protein
MYGYPNLEVYRQDTRDAFSLLNVIADFNQGTWKANEEMAISLGFGRFGGACYWGYTSPNGTNSTTGNTAYIGMYPSFNTLRKNLVFSQNGNTSTSYDFSARNITSSETGTFNTVSATTYLNLPPVPSSQLLPLTLDAAQGRVGINKTDPQYALDVNGTGFFSGEVISYGGLKSDYAELGSVLIQLGATIDLGLKLRSIPEAVKSKMLYYDTTSELVSFADVPVTDVTPITLDKVNNRVGINNASPAYTLDVTGTVNSSGAITAPSVSASTLTGTLATAAQPNVTSVGTLTSLTVTGDVAIDSSTLRVDSTNNRVGVNNASPTQALDVTGNALVSGTSTASGFIATTYPVTNTLAVGYNFGLGLSANVASGARATTQTLLSISLPGPGIYQVNVTLVIIAASGATADVTIPNLQFGIANTALTGNILPWSTSRITFPRGTHYSNVLVKFSPTGDIWQRANVFNDSWSVRVEPGDDPTLYFLVRYNGTVDLGFQYLGNSGRTGLTFTRII